MTHVYLSGHDAPGSTVARSAEEAVSALLCEIVLADVVRLSDLVLSVGVEGVGFDVGLPKSNAVPGVLGVLKPKAPEPSPNALDAPAVGDEMLLVLRGAMLLKGLERP